MWWRTRRPRSAEELSQHRINRLRTIRFGLILQLVSAAILPANPCRAAEEEVPASLAASFRPPPELAGDFGPYRSPLVFDDGRPVKTADQWRERRREILDVWQGAMGPWPPPLVPKIEMRGAIALEGYRQQSVRLAVAPDREVDGYLLIPDGPRPSPAMLIVFYEPESAIGQGKPHVDFARQLALRGIASLSIGFDPREIGPEEGGEVLQPLSFLAYAASNARAALATCPEVDPGRIGVMGHSYGGKWAMFAACLDERFACGVWSDPGVAFDEARANVNYWEKWYLGREPGRARVPGLITAENPRTGAYRALVENGHDLHEFQALMAPRPFLVSGGSEDPPERWRALNHVVAVNDLLGRKDRVAMTNRPGHSPTEESNEQICRFLEFVLKPGKLAEGR